MTKEEISKIIDEAIEKADKKAEKRLNGYDKKAEKRLKEYDARADKRLQHYIDATKEDADYKYALIKEQYTELSEKVGDIEVTVNATFEEVGAMRIELTESNEKLNNHEERITVLEQKVR